MNPNAELSQVLMSTTNDETTYYVYGLGLVSHENSEGYKLYHYDYRGSTTVITNINGTVTDTVYYDPYGNVVKRSGTTETPFLYVGKYGVETDINGLYYMRARYYNPTIQRFINVDPIRDVYNWYGYVGSNGINNIDPNGLYNQSKTISYSQEFNWDVVLIQNALIRKGIIEKNSISNEEWGYFSLDIKDAVNKFKRKNGMPEDGKVDYATWLALGLPEGITYSAAPNNIKRDSWPEFNCYAYVLGLQDMKWYIDNSPIKAVKDKLYGLKNSYDFEPGTIGGIMLNRREGYEEFIDSVVLAINRDLVELYGKGSYARRINNPSDVKLDDSCEYIVAFQYDHADYKQHGTGFHFTTINVHGNWAEKSGTDSLYVYENSSLLNPLDPSKWKTKYKNTETIYLVFHLSEYNSYTINRNNGSNSWVGIN